MRKFGLSLVLALSMVMMMAAAAFAVHTDTNGAETTYQSAELGVAGNQTITNGTQVHAVKDGDATAGVNDSLDCAYCHENQTKHTAGPHGGYTTTSNKCLTCHGVHARSGSNKAWTDRLLPGKTTVEVCNFCHDLTQSDLGPYFSEYMSGKTYDNNLKEKTVKSAHRITGVHVYNAPTAAADGYKGDVNGKFVKANRDVPGGSYTTGGTRDLIYGGQGTLSNSQSGDEFTCDSCHTPHAIAGATVDPYFGESHIKYSASTSNTTLYKADKVTVAGSAPVGRFWLTDRLLKARIEDPNKVRTTTKRVYTQYDSNWCASCHQGRVTSYGGDGEATVHNHPVKLNTMDWNAAEVVQYDQPNAEGYKFLRWATYANGFNEASLKTTAKVMLKDKTGGSIYPTFYASNVADARYVKSAGALWGNTDAWYDVALTGDPRTNKQYVMTAIDPLTNTARPADNFVFAQNAIDKFAGGPSCQQCHGSARDVEQTFAVFKGNADTDNAAMSFPHVSENKALLVEEGDDFCTNCHGLDNLP